MMVQITMTEVKIDTDADIIATASLELIGTCEV